MLASYASQPLLKSRWKGYGGDGNRKLQIAKFQLKIEEISTGVPD